MIFWGGGEGGVSVCVCVCVCVCVFMKLHITAQSGPVILLIVIRIYYENI